LANNKIKVIQIIADSSLSGGPKHVLGLLQNIDKSRFECSLICPAGNLSVEAKKIAGIEVINIKMSSKFDLVSVFEIKAAVSRIQASGDPFGKIIVHIHGVRAGLLARVLLPESVNTIYTEHRYDADYHLKNPLNEFIQKKALKYLNKKTDLIIAVSSSVRDYLTANRLASKNQVVIVPNAIQEQKTENRKQKTGDKGERVDMPVIGTVGSINRQKGQRYLIEAMPVILSRYPKTSLTIAGSGSEEANLKALAAKLGLHKHVRFLGEVSDIERYFETLDVFVLPSIAETFGIVLLEAMQAGVPIVATKVGGVPDVIEDDKNGLLVKSRNSKSLADAIIRVLSKPSLAAKLRANGFSRLEEFDWKKIIERIENLYERV